jgi:hypothetical protein
VNEECQRTEIPDLDDGICVMIDATHKKCSYGCVQNYDCPSSVLNICTPAGGGGYCK